MKTFEELLNTEEPGWAVVQEWLRAATNPVEVLPSLDEIVQPRANRGDEVRNDSKPAVKGNGDGNR